MSRGVHMEPTTPAVDEIRTSAIEKLDRLTDGGYVSVAHILHQGPAQNA